MTTTMNTMINATINAVSAVAANKAAKNVAGFYAGKALSNLCASTAKCKLNDRVYLVCEMRHAGYKGDCAIVKYNTDRPLMETVDLVAAEKFYNFCRSRKQPVILVTNSPFCNRIGSADGVEAEDYNSGWIILSTTGKGYRSEDHFMTVLFSDGHTDHISTKEVIDRLHEIEAEMINNTDRCGSHKRFTLRYKGRSNFAFRGVVKMHLVMQMNPITDGTSVDTKEKDDEIRRLKKLVSESENAKEEIKSQCSEMNNKRREMLNEIEALKSTICDLERRLQPTVDVAVGCAKDNKPREEYGFTVNRPRL